MRDARRARILVAILGGIAFVLGLVIGLMGCSDKPTEHVEVDSTDQMFTEEVRDDVFYVFQLGDQTITAKNYSDVDIPWEEPLTDGGFYKVVADVTYLNGGVAGYVDFPQVHDVKSCEEVSPLEMGLPSVADQTYGLMLIGDYADGDVLFNERGIMAVWKDGGWLYRYDGQITLVDGTVAGVREGVTKAEVEAGIQSGVLACEDYFALLPER